MKVHPVFHVSLLKLYKGSNYPNKHPPSEIIGNNEKYEIKEVLDSHCLHRYVQYLVKWKGYPDCDNQWEPPDVTVLMYMQTCTPSMSGTPKFPHAWKLLHTWNFPAGHIVCLQVIYVDESAPTPTAYINFSPSQTSSSFLLFFFLVSHLVNSTKSQVRSCSTSSSGLV